MLVNFFKNTFCCGAGSSTNAYSYEAAANSPGSPAAPDSSAYGIAKKTVTGLFSLPQHLQADLQKGILALDDPTYRKIAPEQAYAGLGSSVAKGKDVEEGYDSGEEDGKDWKGESAVETLRRALPYVILANAAYRLPQNFESVFKGFAEDLQLQNREEWSINKFELIQIRNPLVGRAINTDTEVYVAHVKQGEKSILVIAFRGTEVDVDGKGDSRLSDLVTDLMFAQKPLEFWAGKKLAYGPHKDIKMHAGFLDAFKDVTCTATGEGLQHLDTYLKAAMDMVMEGTQYDSVVCCGHSLGAALATLCALWCVEVAYAGVADPPKISCFTVASPRVGNAAFAELFDKKVPDSIRIVNKLDIVPGLPYPPVSIFPLSMLNSHNWYKHVSGSIWITERKVKGVPAMVVLQQKRPFGYAFQPANHPMAQYRDSLNKVLNGMGRSLPPR